MPAAPPFPSADSKPVFFIGCQVSPGGQHHRLSFFLLQFPRKPGAQDCHSHANKGRTLEVALPGSWGFLKVEPQVHSSSRCIIVNTGAPWHRGSPCAQATVIHELAVSQSLSPEGPPLSYLTLQAFG